MKKIYIPQGGGRDFWLRIPMNNESAGRHLCMDDVKEMHVWLESGYGGCWTLRSETDGGQRDGIAALIPASQLGYGTYSVVMAGKFVNDKCFRTKRQLFIRLVDREDQADAEPTMYNEEQAYWAGPAVLSEMLSRDGLNTYELAVIHGYTGTLEEFLEISGLELQDYMVTKPKLSLEVQEMLDKVNSFDTSNDADLDIDDENNNTLVRFSDGHVKTKNFDSRDLKTFVDDNETSDLDLSDEEGYTIARFSDGHVKTKYFDSSKVNITTSSKDNVDLSLDDENDYSIVQFKNGHVKTKNFDSSKVRYANYKDYQRRVFFTHTVNCVNWLDTSFNAADIDTMEDIVEYSDNCVLYLPTSYSKTGNPCKLIIYCKYGASTIEPSEDSILTGSMGKIFRYMLSLGYAIVAADGVPNGWVSAIGLSERASGNYVAVQSTIKAYNYVTENYNISKDDVMIFGYSQGGAYALNVIENTPIPISCAALISPVISFRYHLWDAASSVTIGGVTYTKASRLNVARIFNFPAVTTNAQLLALEYDYGKTSGFDPWFRNVDDMYTGFVQDGVLWKLPNGVSLDDITMKKHLRCPVKVWFAENDAVLGCDVGKVFVRALKNAGVSSDIEIKSTGGHDIVGGQTAIGSFIENGQSVSLYPMAKDIATWYNINGGY